MNERRGSAVRYTGRNSSPDATFSDVTVQRDEAVLFDDAVPAQTIAAEIGLAEVVFIDDPLSFPWEVVTNPPTAPLIIDIGRCSSDQLIALTPALTHITEYDTIVDRTGANHQSNQFAHLLGARSVEPTAFEIVELGKQKHLHYIETCILSRLGREWQTLVVDFADLFGTPWPSTTWSDPADTRPSAVVVRVPVEVLRQRGGLTAMAAELVETVAGRWVLDVWGIRSHPGEPMSRGLVVIGVDR